MKISSLLIFGLLMPSLIYSQLSTISSILVFKKHVNDWVPYTKNEYEFSEPFQLDIKYLWNNGNWIKEYEVSRRVSDNLDTIFKKMITWDGDIVDKVDYTKCYNIRNESEEIIDVIQEERYSKINFMIFNKIPELNTLASCSRIKFPYDKVIYDAEKFLKDRIGEQKNTSTHESCLDNNFISEFFHLKFGQLDELISFESDTTLVVIKRNSGDNVLPSHNTHINIVYPNPFSGVLNISLNSEGIEQIEILNQAGEIVFSQKNINKQLSSLDLNHLSAGIYMINIYFNGARHSEKIIKIN